MSSNLFSALFAGSAKEKPIANDLVQRLVDMGYSHQQAKEACKRCSSTEAALEWILNQDARKTSSQSAPPRGNLEKTKEPAATVSAQLWVSARNLFGHVLGASGPASAPLPEATVKLLCDSARAVLAEEANILVANSPVTIVGDIHGQFHDLLRIFEAMGFTPDVNYIFLGDYVDRGSNSVETIQLLIALKVRFPSRVALLRGNHECRAVSKVFGFYDEVKYKYGSSTVWGYFVNLFDYFPLGCLIDSSILCVHGGLSPQAETLDAIRSIDRVQEVPFDGPMVDLLWSDPAAADGWGESSRGAGYLFGPDTSEKFNCTNGLNLLCRAHQLVPAGYKWMHDKRVLTVFSAPGYGTSSNRGAAMTINESKEFGFHQFDICISPESVGLERHLLDDAVANSGVLAGSLTDATADF